jgi:hypothetical protein
VVVAVTTGEGAGFGGSVGSSCFGGSGGGAASGGCVLQISIASRAAFAGPSLGSLDKNRS